MSVEDRLRVVRQRIAEAATRSGRATEVVRLVGVSKGFPPELVVEAVAAGLGDIGENRVQEAAAKIPAVEAALSRPPRWHLVGHLQTNKVKAALELFDTIESVDSVHVAQAISRRAERPIPIFLEVQFVRAPDRFGFEVGSLPSALEEMGSFPNIEIVGLMTVPPLGLSEEGTRQVFRTLREHRDRLQGLRPDLPALELSMGMTDDYPIAIEEGATVVRIGRAIFAS